MKLKIKPLSPMIGREIPLPYYATGGAAALDLHACIDRPAVIPGGGRMTLPTGLAVAILENHVGIVAIRSSMGIKNGVTLTNGIGVIDSDYRGPVQVSLHNLNKEPYTVRPGDRIAQLIIVPVTRQEVEVVDELPDTARGQGGIGSTGR